MCLFCDNWEDVYNGQTEREYTELGDFDNLVDFLETKSHIAI